MFTTAGETRLIMGASVGTGASPTAGGKAAWAVSANVATMAASENERVLDRMDMWKRILKR
jgi:hypothetical protein